MQVDKMSETLAEMHSKAGRKEARQAELEEQVRRVSEVKHESAMVRPHLVQLRELNDK